MIVRYDLWKSQYSINLLLPRVYHENFPDGAKSFFLIFFPGVKCFFPVENFHFGRPETNFSGFEKWEEIKKNKKIKSSPHFVNFSTFHFQFSTFPFTIFLLFFSIFAPFPFFPCHFFPGRLAEI